MLHVLNGDATREQLERAGVAGEITVWADVLHDGPVPDLPAAQLRRVRADHLRHTFGVAGDQVDREFRRQEALDDFRRHEEVIFWFEHDLFDQLLLVRHLDWLSQIDRGSTRFSLVCRDEYLGPLPPSRLGELFPERVAITEEQIEAGRQAWTLFTSERPSDLVEWVAQGRAGSLEFLPGALHRLFEEFPSTDNGLSRTERQALVAVRQGASTLKETFIGSQHMEERIFMGDLTFWTVVRRLSEVAHPLLAVSPASPALNGDTRVSLTAAGRRVLDCGEDHVALNGIDRWIGGVHLTPERCWRWNGALLVS